MKILLVDNGSKHLIELQKWANDFDSNEVIINKINQINLKNLSSFDLIILSGGHGHSIVNHPEEYSQEINLIKETNKPILGICLGCELIAYAFGSKLERLERKETSVVKLKIIAKDHVVQNMGEMKVHEGHSWFIKELGPELKVVATSSDGIEIIKHISLPIYGFQFHPELDSNQGISLLHNLIMKDGRSAAV